MLKSTPAIKISHRLHGVFLLSGVCGLGYQMVWTRMLMGGIGHEMPAVLAVIAAFFGGIALGGWGLGKKLADTSRPVGWCASLEAVIGLWAFCSIWLIPRANELAIGWIGLDASFVRHWLVAFAVPFLVLLPATVAMGATLPAMERVVSTLTPNQKSVGSLYAVNTLGAVAGVLISAFWVIPALGYAQTVMLLGGLNLLCAALLWWLGKWAGDGVEKPASAEAAKPMLKRQWFWLFWSGLLGIGYEVVGVRLLAQVLENTVYTYAAALSVFLLGTAIGATLFQAYKQRRVFQRILLWLPLGMCVLCLLSVWIVFNAPTIYRAAQGWFGGGVIAVKSAEWFVAAAVFALPALGMGMIFSHLAQSVRDARGNLGNAVALNTLGSALAPALFGVLLLPWLGSKAALVLLGFGYLLLLARFNLAIGLALVVPLGIFALLPRTLTLVTPPVGGRVLEYREGVMDSVAVVELFDKNRSLLVNNRFTMGGTGSVIAEQRHTHIPMLLHPNPRRAAFLGLGTGITFAAAGAYPELRADGVELVPEVIEVFPQFAPYNELPPSGRLKLHVADARRFIRTGMEPYDVIVADLFHPSRDGAGALYTREHFAAIRARLAPGGVFCQWLPLYQLDEATLRSITRTFLEVFPTTHAFLLRFNVDTPVIGLFALPEGLDYRADWLKGRLNDETLAEQLKAVTLGDEFQLFGNYLGGAEALKRFAQNAPINTDNHPVVIFQAPEFAYDHRQNAHDRLFTLLRESASDPAMLFDTNHSTTSAFLADLRAYVRARDVYLQGLVAEGVGERAKAIDAYVESAQLSPNFSTGYARCLSIAMSEAKANPVAAKQLLERLVEAQPERPVARQLLERLFAP